MQDFQPTKPVTKKYPRVRKPLCKRPASNTAIGILRILHWDKMDQKRILRATHAAEPFHQEPAPAFDMVRKARDKRAYEISNFNQRCTKMEVKAKEGKMGKEGFAGIFGAKHPPFILKLGRITNTGYRGTELRAIRAVKGCGSPVHA